MKSISDNWKSKDFLLFIIFLQVLTFTTTLFDVPVARQVIGFAFYTIIPGLIIIKLLKLENLDGLEKFLLSVGFSIAFLMIGGLLINEIGFALGISEPLSLLPLLIILNVFIFIGAFVVYLRSDDVTFLDTKNLSFHPVVLILVALPIVSIIGALSVNAYHDNSILLALIIAIAVIVALGGISQKFLPKRFYPLALFSIGLALLFHASFISEYICTFGSDVPVEYYVFKSTQNSAYWDSATAYPGGGTYGRIHSMLSVTVLPTVHSTLLNIDEALIFKLVFPIIFSFVALCLYRSWQGYLGKRLSFIAAFFFIAYNIFYTEMLGLNRQIVAELFFVLLLFVILNKKLKPSNKVICFAILSFGLVTSHYGLSEIFLFLIAFIVILGFVTKRPSRNITPSIVTIFFIIMFTWYIYLSGSAVFDSFVEFSGYLYNQVGGFFDLASRGTTVLRGLGLEAPPTIWNAISRAFAYGTQLLIVVGFLGLITKRVSAHFDKDFITLSFIAMSFLGALLLVPGLANTMNMTRFYHILLIFLAPLSVLGAEVIVKLISKRKNELVISVMLLTLIVPYFVFQTGFVYEVTESEVWSLPLSKDRLDGWSLYRGNGYIDDASVFGAKWLSENVNVRRTTLYADLSSTYNVLTIYGFIYRARIHQLSNTTYVTSNGTIYLSPLNTVYNVVDTQYYRCNTSDLSFLHTMNKIYTNGGSEIYRKPF